MKQELKQTVPETRLELSERPDVAAQNPHNCRGEGRFDWAGYCMLVQIALAI